VSESDVIVLKIGGSVAGEHAAALDAIASLHDSGHNPVSYTHLTLPTICSV